MIHIAIAEGHTLTRKCLSLLINSSGHMEVVTEAATGQELLHALTLQRADVLLFDLHMPGTDGFHTAGHISEYYPDIKIIALSLTDDPDIILKVIRSGFHGYFTKNTDPRELQSAITQLQHHDFHFEKRLTGIIKPLLQHRYAGSTAIVQVVISEREKEIICLTAKELCGKEIAARLHIAHKTVQRHKENLIRKTGAKNFTGVLVYALSHHILSVTDL